VGTGEQEEEGDEQITITRTKTTGSNQRALVAAGGDAG